MRRNKNKFKLYTLALIMSIGIVWSTSFIFVHAAVNNSFLEGQICSPDTDQVGSQYNVARCVNNIYTVSIAIGGFYAILMFVIAGYLYAFGNEGSVKKARELISSTVIGLILLFSAFAILNTIDPRLTSFKDLVLLPAVNCDGDRCTLPELPPPTTRPGGGYNIGGVCNKTYRTPADVAPDLVTISYDYTIFADAHFGDLHGNTGTVKMQSLQKGSLQVNACIQNRTVNSLAALNVRRFPLYKPSGQQPIEGYNWRYIAGTNTLSVHSFGVAIDINPMQNGHFKRGGIVEPGGAFYEPCPSTSARVCSPYSITPAVAAVLKNTGFGWGGDWDTSKDYMHFSCAKGEHGNCGN